MAEGFHGHGGSGSSGSVIASPVTATRLAYVEVLPDENRGSTPPFWCGPCAGLEHEASGSGG